MNFQEIKNILPHRYPFLLIDKVVTLEEKRIVALKNVTANEPFFVGHFPEFAVMPGVLQIEAMAQAGGLLLASSGGFDREKDLAFLAGVDEAKFKRPVVPGDQLVIEVLELAKKGPVFRVSAEAKVDGEMVSKAVVTLVVKGA